MNEAHAKTQLQSVRVEYTPPSRDSLYRFALKVCEVDGDQSPDTVHGLTDFLVVCAQIKAKQMSSRGIRNGQ